MLACCRWRSAWSSGRCCSTPAPAPRRPRPTLAASAAPVPAQRRRRRRWRPSRSAPAAGSSGRSRRAVEAAAPAAPAAGHRRRRPRRAPTSACRRTAAVAGAQRQLLPDRHRAGGARRRPQRLEAADPRDGRPARSRSPTSELVGRQAHRGLGDDLLRLQPGRRRPDRQRLVERGADRRPARARPGSRPGPTRSSRPPQDGWTCGTPIEALTDDRNAMLAVGDERRAAPARARLPGADDRARALRLRVGDQVGRRPRGDPVRPTSAAYWTDRGWSEQGPVKTESRDRGAPRRQRRRRPGTVRVGGHRLGAAHRHREGGVPPRRRRVAGGRARPGPGQRHLGAVGRHRRRTAGRATRSRCGPPTGPATRRPRRAPTSCPTARPAGTA